MYDKGKLIYPKLYAEALKCKFITDISFLIEFLKGVLGLFLS